MEIIVLFACDLCVALGLSAQAPNFTPGMQCPPVFELGKDVVCQSNPVESIPEPRGRPAACIWWESSGNFPGIGFSEVILVYVLRHLYIKITLLDSRSSAAQVHVAGCVLQPLGNSLKRDMVAVMRKKNCFCCGSFHAWLVLHRDKSTFFVFSLPFGNRMPPFLEFLSIWDS
jgi:hypothetical protein